MTENSELRAGSAILKDLKLLNKAAIFLENRIQPHIRAEITDLVKSCMKSNGWIGVGDASNALTDIWISPRAWKMEGGKDEVLASFTFYYEKDQESDSYEIADLFGVGETGYGFWFEPVYGYFGGKNKWIAFAKNNGALFAKISEKGWVDKGKGLFFKPVCLSSNLLIPSWESGDWSDALAPMKEVMESIFKDKDVFIELIELAQSKE